MKLLMITRKVDREDALAGFTYNWVKKIGNNLDELYVIAWQKSDASGLPDNIKVDYLPENKIKKVFSLWWKLVKVLPKVDGVFCHMNPEYTILSAPLAKIFRKRVVSWYTHRAVTFRRRLLEIFASRIITASEKSFRRPWFTNKVEVVGHGIDTEQFKPDDARGEEGRFDIITVGRISPTKDYESIIKAIYEVNNKIIHLNIVGDVILKSQVSYLSSLKNMVSSMGLEDQVTFSGWVPNKNMRRYYQESDLFINMSGTGSVDKVVLEAMACNLLVLTSNEAFVDILPKDLMVEKNNPEILAEQIKRIMNFSTQERIILGQELRQVVVDNHNLDNLALKIIKQFS